MVDTILQKSKIQNRSVSMNWADRCSETALIGGTIFVIASIISLFLNLCHISISMTVLGISFLCFGMAYKFNKKSQEIDAKLEETTDKELLREAEHNVENIRSFEDAMWFYNYLSEIEYDPKSCEPFKTIVDSVREKAPDLLQYNEILQYIILSPKTTYEGLIPIADCNETRKILSSVKCNENLYWIDDMNYMGTIIEPQVEAWLSDPKHLKKANQMRYKMYKTILDRRIKRLTEEINLIQAVNQPG